MAGVAAHGPGAPPKRRCRQKTSAAVSRTAAADTPEVIVATAAPASAIDVATAGTLASAATAAAPSTPDAAASGAHTANSGAGAGAGSNSGLLVGATDIEASTQSSRGMKRGFSFGEEGGNDDADQVLPASAANVDDVVRIISGALAASLLLACGALPRDDRGMCVTPHPHKLTERTAARRMRTEIGVLAYDTSRRCDNCDKQIEERCWFACSEGCDLDFCGKCHAALKKLFEGRDADFIAWVVQFMSSVAEYTLTSTSVAQRQALVHHLAFDWPLKMFDLLIQAVADVADAMVVHVQDGGKCEIANDADFWHMVGFMQLCRAANNLPASQLRFGELVQRGPRIPCERFVLRAIDKCDASAEWNRWKQEQSEYHFKDHAQHLVLESKRFKITRSFAFFLAHGDLIPIGFRQRCLLGDVNDAAFGSERRILEMRMVVPRDPGPLRQVMMATLGQEEANVATFLQVSFEGEPGEGPGVIREFLSLAVQSLLRGDRSGGGGSSSNNVGGREGGAGVDGVGSAIAGETSLSPLPLPGAGVSVPEEGVERRGWTPADDARAIPAAPDARASVEGDTGWSYDPHLRTYWFAEPMEVPPEAYRALGALLGHSMLANCWIPVAFPRVLYALLLREVGSSQVPRFTLSDVASVMPSIASGLQELVDYEAADVAEIFSLDWPNAAQLEASAGEGPSQKGKRAAYVDAYVQWFFTERFVFQFAPFASGFREVVGGSRMLRTNIDAAQLEQILCGTEEPLNVDAVRSTAEESGWAPRDRPYLDSFWEVLRGFTSTEQKSFVVFVSACGRMPPQGWQDFPLRLQRNGEGDWRLPSAHTCFNLLLLPRYSSAEVLRARLRAAIMETEGFGLS